MRSRIVPVFAFAALGVLAGPAGAQLKVGGGGVDVQGPNNTAVVAAAGETVRDMRRPGGQTLRCWQNGRLLYEGSGFRGGGVNATGGAAINVPRRSDGEPVTVLNLQHAVCILSDS
jgi:hypothetical protein